MSLRLFACRESSNVLWQLDDESVLTDDGEAFAPMCETHPVDFGAAGGQGKLRELLQWVQPRGLATITATPVADNLLRTTQAQPRPVDVATGAAQRLEVPFAASGTRFGVQLVVSDFTAGVQLGEADILYIPRRSKTGGRS